ncbi:MAG: NrsF family protein, partial [Acidobacteriota bacterium]
LQLLVGLALVGFALRESIPGSGLPSGVVTAMATTAVLMQIVIGIATWLYSPGPVLSSGALAKGVGCMTHDTAMALPTLIATLWLVFHALPVRAPIAGLLGGAGAAVTADAITHLVCPMSDLRHVLVWHTGAMLGLMLIGWAVGVVWDRRQLR